MQVYGELFDGKSSKSEAVEVLFLEDETVQIKNTNTVLYQTVFSDVVISSRLADTPRILKFKNGFVVHTKQNDKIDEVLKSFKNKKSYVHILETNTKYAIFALVMIILTTVFLLTVGSSFTAKYLAKMTPYFVEKEISKHTLETLDKYILKDSNLTQKKKDEVSKVFQRLTKGESKYHLHFKRGIGENAFALPSGDIVITDELIKFSKGDMDMIFGVLAHEKGHIVYKHSMQMVIKASIVTALVTYFTGDASSLVATAGTALINAKYSREFEQQADDYAKLMMKKEHISPKHLADFFIRMEKKYHGKGGDNFFASHPSNKKRIENLLK